MTKDGEKTNKMTYYLRDSHLDHEIEISMSAEGTTDVIAQRLWDKILKDMKVHSYTESANGKPTFQKTQVLESEASKTSKGGGT